LVSVGFTSAISRSDAIVTRLDEALPSIVIWPHVRHRFRRKELPGWLPISAPCPGRGLSGVMINETGMRPGSQRIKP